MAQTIINNNDTGLAVRTALNSMFTELYGNTVAIPIKLLNQTGSFTQVIATNTWIEKIHAFAHSGVPDIKIGTSLGGNEILDTIQVGNDMAILLQRYFATGCTLYFVVSGGNVDLRIEEINSYL